MSSLQNTKLYVWPSMRKYKFSIFAIFLLYGLRIFFVYVLGAILLKNLVDLLGIENVSEASILNVIYMIIAVYFLSTIFARSSKFFVFDFEIKMNKDLRDFCFQKLIGNSKNFFSDNFSGSLVNKSKKFVTSFEQLFDMIVYGFYSTLVILVGSLVVMFKQSKTITLYFIIFIILYLIVLLFFLKKKMKYDMIDTITDSKIGGLLSDVFSNILTVKIFSENKKEIREFSSATDEARKNTKTAWFYVLKLEVIQGFFIFIVQSIILYALIHLWLDKKITTGTVVLIQTYSVFIFDKLWELNNTLMRFTRYVTEMTEVMNIFNIVPDIQDPKNPEKLNMTKGHLVLDNVSFAYKNGQEVFSNFSIDIAPGERIGLVGHSGAGKSTFTNLILRFSDVSAGSVTIDGQDIRNVTQDDLRSVISYVPQESILFHRTIRENIAYGKDSATDEDVIEVAKKAYAHDFIEKLPYQYETYVGERGVKLSGGERQRVAIARAMIKDAPILILDEATSSLDSVSETYIQKAFDELMKNKTTIVIAHRLSTISKMDRILVLEDGKITEQGTHADLIARGGDYADLWNHQVGGFIE